MCLQVTNPGNNSFTGVIYHFHVLSVDTYKYMNMYLYNHIYTYIYRGEKLWFFFGGLPQTLIQINPSSLPLNLVTFDFAGRCCWLFDLSVEVTLIDLLQPHHLMLGWALSRQQFILKDYPPGK